MSLEEVRAQNIRLVTEKALDCFINNGIANTTVSDIAKASGLTERSVYRYFTTKSDHCNSRRLLLLGQSQGVHCLGA